MPKWTRTIYDFLKGSLFFSPFNNVFFTLPFFPTLETFFFHPQKSFFPTLWNLFFSPFENLFFSPCTLPFSPCSMFLSPFTLFFSPFTLSFSPSTLSFQPSAGEAGNPWNLRRERCHLRLVSRRVCAAAKPEPPSGNCAETIRNDANRRKLTRTPPGREALQQSVFHPPFFFHPRNLLFSPSKIIFYPPCGTFFFHPSKTCFFHPAPCHFHPVACFFHPSPCFFHPLPFLFHPRPFLVNPPPAKQVTPGTCAENDVTSG